MTKAEIVDKVARDAGLAKTDAQAIVQTVLDSMTQTLRRGERIELRGFGSFCHRRQASRRGRNPKTGAEVVIPARQSLRFKPGKELREMLNPSSGSDQK